MMYYLLISSPISKANCPRSRCSSKSSAVWRILCCSLALSDSSTKETTEDQMRMKTRERAKRAMARREKGSQGLAYSWQQERLEHSQEQNGEEAEEAEGKEQKWSPPFEE